MTNIQRLSKMAMDETINNRELVKWCIKLIEEGLKEVI